MSVRSIKSVYENPRKTPAVILNHAAGAMKNLNDFGYLRFFVLLKQDSE